MNGIFDKQLAKFGFWLSVRLIKIELLLIFFAFIGYLLYQNKFISGEVITIVSLVSLSVVYFFLGYSKESESSRWTSFYVKLIYYSLTIFSVALLFALMHWPGFEVQLHLAVITLTMALFVGLIETVFIKKSMVFKKLEFIRLLFSLFVVLYFIIITDSDPFVQDMERVQEIDKNIPEARP